MSGSAPSASAGGDPGQAFRFCPSCGAGGFDFLDGKRWLCKRCGFEYFHNVATAAGVILHCPEGIALLDSEALSIAFRPLEGIRAGDLAFPSLARALEAYAKLCLIV